jgi:hypothetical protein
LEHGVKVWRGYDAKHKRSLIHFEIVGAKVKARQGQPVRHIAYAEEDGHKTQQRYGTASQASHGRLLRPVIVKPSAPSGGWGHGIQRFDQTRSNPHLEGAASNGAYIDLLGQ